MTTTGLGLILHAPVAPNSGLPVKGHRRAAFRVHPAGEGHARAGRVHRVAALPGQVGNQRVLSCSPKPVNTPSGPSVLIRRVVEDSRNHPTAAAARGKTAKTAGRVASGGTHPRPPPPRRRNASLRPLLASWGEGHHDPNSGPVGTQTRTVGALQPPSSMRGACDRSDPHGKNGSVNTTGTEIKDTTSTARRARAVDCGTGHGVATRTSESSRSARQPAHHLDGEIPVNRRRSPHAPIEEAP